MLGSCKQQAHSDAPPGPQLGKGHVLLHLASLVYAKHQPGKSKLRTQRVTHCSSEPSRPCDGEQDAFRIEQKAPYIRSRLTLTAGIPALSMDARESCECLRSEARDALVETSFHQVVVGVHHLLYESESSQGSSRELTKHSCICISLSAAMTCIWSLWDSWSMPSRSLQPRLKICTPPAHYPLPPTPVPGMAMVLGDQKSAPIKRRPELFDLECLSNKGPK